MSILNDGEVITGQQQLAPFGFPPEYRPDALVLPREGKDLCALVRWAQAERVALWPVGGCTAVQSCIGPFTGGVAVSSRKLNRILEVRPDNLSVEVESGVTAHQLQGALQPYRLTLPVRPPRPRESTLGGQVARNAAGPKALRDGGIRDYLLGANFVSPTGELIRAGGKNIKNVSGYDVTRLMAGSYGTLGMLTSLVFRVRPLPEREGLLIMSFDGYEPALDAARSILLSPYDAAFLHLWPAHLLAERGFPAGEKGWVLVACLEGLAELVREQAAALAEIAAQNAGACRVLFEEKYFDEYYRLYDAPWGDRGTGERAVYGLIAATRKSVADVFNGWVTGVQAIDPLIWADLGRGQVHFFLEEAAEETLFALRRLAAEHHGALRLDYPEVSYYRPAGPGSAIWMVQRLKQALDPAGILAPAARALKGV
ncbi:hypothetical protein SY88_16440 [Clostridiales bacterium PH28_bin88]|nr:hypothetical protein SY88_16440 [Clostridiales bacterium PH28_bin88]